MTRSRRGAARDAEELAAFLLAFDMIYGERELPGEASQAFANGWHAALAWVTDEVIKEHARHVEEAGGL